MKQYRFSLTIDEGSDEFWEEIKDKTGCDEVYELVLNCLLDYGFTLDDVDLELVRFQKVYDNVYISE